MFFQELDSVRFFARLLTLRKRWYVFIFRKSHTLYLPINTPQIYTSAVALSTVINTSELDAGRLYPDLDRIREVSVIVAREVIREAQRQGLDRETSIRDLSDPELDAWIRSRMYDPTKENGLGEQMETFEIRDTNIPQSSPSRRRIPSSSSKL